MVSNNLNKDTKRSLFRVFVDTTTAKLTIYREIVAHATKLRELRNGKTRQNKNAGAGRSSRQVGGSARGLPRKALNKGLKELQLADALKAAREKAAVKRKLAVE